MTFSKRPSQAHGESWQTRPHVARDLEFDTLNNMLDMHVSRLAFFRFLDLWRCLAQRSGSFLQNYYVPL